jgi:hypothetical protein
MQPIGIAVTPSTNRRQIPAGGTAVVFVWLDFDTTAPVPDRLRHRVTTNGVTAEGAVIGTHQSELHTLGAPLKGANWIASSGPSNGSYHRRGFLVIDGTTVIDRRYAIDWRMMRDGSVFTGDENEARSYHAYGNDVLAVASGTVITATDGIPDNVPRHQGFRPAVPITLDTLAGNTITLDLGGGQYAYYMHLHPGSLTVKAGDHVEKGQVLARVGNSGDSREPHLHFEVTTSPKLLAGEGVPYVIDRYFFNAPNQTGKAHRRELPLNDMLVDFRSFFVAH